MIKTSSNFQQAYSRLNNEQKVAVDQIDGPVMVIAGPGTGKTQVLATRIANILLKTDTNPSSILAMTFSESGAKAMKKRLISLIGTTAYSVRIQTFHSFCMDVIGENPEYFAHLDNRETLAEFERFQIFQDILAKGKFEWIKPAGRPDMYIRTLNQKIQDLKREGVQPDQFDKIVQQEEVWLEANESELKKTQLAQRKKNLGKLKELQIVYRAYEKELVQRGRYDFEDMIIETIKAFLTHELLLRTYQERFQYFLIDEYQDTNSAQNQILDLLAEYWGDQANVFVVGDPHQSIYRFQGASLENTYGFFSRYPKATVITLKENYRSTQTILETAQQLISNNPPPPKKLPVELQQHLHAQHGDGSLVELFQPPSQTVEYLYIAQEIQQLLQQGTKPSEIAILFRENSEAQQIAHVLSQRNIPYEVEAGQNVLQEPIIIQLLNLFKLIRDISGEHDDQLFFTVCNYAWVNLDANLTLRLARFAYDHKTTLLESILKTELREEFLLTLPEDQKPFITTFQEFVEKLILWHRLDAQTTLPLWFETVVNESGFLQYVLDGEDTVNRLTALNSFFTELRRQFYGDHILRLKEFLTNIEIMVQHNLVLTVEEITQQRDAVRLLTAHKSKGLEWQYVFVIGLIDGKWGNKKKSDLLPLPERILQHTKVSELDPNEDDRRLLYVALTRAKKQLYLTVPLTTQSSEQISRERLPSMFINELPEQTVQTREEFLSEEQIEKELTQIFTPVTHTPAQAGETELLNQLLENFSLSSTSLNTYLECAYKFKLFQLYRVPRSKEPHLSYGTAIHKALERFFIENKRTQQTPSLGFVLDEFQKSLRKELITEEEYAVWLAKGQKTLEKFYQEQLIHYQIPLSVEKKFGNGSSQPRLDDIPLKGKMDKLEWIDRSEKTVRVVDYKTGQPKSRNAIEGKTQSGDMNYKRQILFYKLLADHDPNFGEFLNEAEFVFVEPNPSGKFVSHRFQFNTEEIEDLKTEIKNTMSKIRQHQFPRTTDYTICASCELNKHCWPEGIPRENLELKTDNS